MASSRISHFPTPPAWLLFREHLVGPLDKAYEDARIGEGRVLANEVAIQNPTGSRASPSDMHRDLVI